MLDKNSITTSAWFAIENNCEIRNIQLERGKVTFWANQKFLFRKSDNYRFILEKADGKEYLYATIVFEGIEVKEKLHRNFFGYGLSRNTDFNYMSLFLTGILSFEDEKTSRGL